MRNESEIPFADNPFTIPVAERMRRLPPYLFAKINKVKYEKRQAGIDVIDLGMGNPTDPPEQIIQDKLAEAGRRMHGGDGCRAVMGREQGADVDVGHAVAVG